MDREDSEINQAGWSIHSDLNICDLHFAYLIEHHTYSFGSVLQKLELGALVRMNLRVSSIYESLFISMLLQEISDSLHQSRVEYFCGFPEGNWKA